MKASLSIDRLVDLSLNCQYKIVTKKGYWCIPSSLGDLNKFLHQRVQSVSERRTNRWDLGLPVENLSILLLFAFDVTRSETRSGITFFGNYFALVIQTQINWSVYRQACLHRQTDQ